MAQIHQFKPPFYNELEQRFAEHLDCVSACEPSWFLQARKEAYTRFIDLGFPTNSDEAWKYTKLSALQRQVYGLHERVSIGHKTLQACMPEALQKLDAYIVVCVAGYVVDALSNYQALPDGVLLRSLASDGIAAQWQHYYQTGNISSSKGEAVMSTVADYNLAFVTDGVVLDVQAGIELDKPVVVVHLDESGDDYSCHMRHHIKLAEGAKAQLIYYYGTLDEEEDSHDVLHCWDNHVSVIEIQSHAQLEHYQLQEKGGSVFHTAACDVHVKEKATYAGCYLSHGLHVARNELYGHLEGKGAACHVRGVGLGRLDQHLDTFWPVYHHHPDTKSSQLYKSVLDDDAKGVFYGKVVVPESVPGCDAHQLNHNMLLSGKAQAFTRPELEIATNDVTCSHGASVGQLDDMAMYYLTSRGLDDAQAKALLVQGFIEAVFESVEPALLQQLFHDSVMAWLRQDQIIPL